MAKESVVQLYRDAQADSALKEKLNSASNLEAFVEMARTYGYTFTVEEWREMTRFSVEELKSKVSEIPGL